MSLPRLEMPIVRTSYVQNLDIVPTLLDYLGLEWQGHGFAGRSLRALIERGESPALAFSSMGSHRSVNDERYKLMRDLKRGDGGWALFDLRDDPAERRNLIREERGVLRRLRKELEEWMRTAGDADLEERLERAREIEQELRQLGYLG